MFTTVCPPLLPPGTSISLRAQVCQHRLISHLFHPFQPFFTPFLAPFPLPYISRALGIHLVLVFSITMSTNPALFYAYFTSSEPYLPLLRTSTCLLNSIYTIYRVVSIYLSFVLKFPWPANTVLFLA